MTITDSSSDPPETQKLTGGDAVLRMRDEFIQLAQGYAHLREYEAAREALVLAQLLEKFEDDHNITNMLWPPRLVDDEMEPAGKAFAEVDR